jgi:anti-sigma factor ChrR (cupin superfamily)
MKPHDELHDDDRDRAAQYVLCGLEPDATHVYEAHLEICELCRAEVVRCREAVEILGRAVEPTDPPPSLKARLLERVHPDAVSPAAVQTWKAWQASPAGVKEVIVRGSDGDWQATAIAGVSVRRLYVDRAADRVTMLVRMAAGCTYPAHRHGGVEECYVVEGDLYGPGFEMKAGDYQRLEGGSVHGIQGTRAGCVALIISSLHDELLPA